MEKIVTFSGSGIDLNIVFRGYEREFALDPDDANWLLAFAEINGPGAHFVTSIGVTATDLREMIEELRNVLSGRKTAVGLGCLEEQLTIEMQRKGSAGHFLVLARLEAISAVRISVECTFEADEDHLVGALRGLEAVASAFPVRDGMERPPH